MRLRLLVALLGAFIAYFGATAVAKAATLPHGAPLCDDRGASAYAAEPAPQPVDAGTITATKTDACKSIALLEAGAPVPSRDELQRSPELAKDLAIVPSATLTLPVYVLPAPTFPRPEGDDARDGHPQTDNPPPKPIPWRG